MWTEFVRTGTPTTAISASEDNPRSAQSSVGSYPLASGSESP